MLQRNTTSTKRTNALSFDWRRAILHEDRPATLQSRVDSISLILLPLGERSREATTRRRTEGEAGSPRVADRSSSLAVLPSSPPVLYQRYTTTSPKRQARRFPTNGFY